MKLYIVLATLFLSTSCFAQKKLINKLLSTQKDTTRSASFLPVPTIGYSQERGLELGAGAIYSFYIDKLDPLNRSTNIYGNASYSTKGTYNLGLKADAWTAGNQLHLIGELKFKKIPFDFYGVGNSTREVDADRLVQTQIKVGVEVEKLISKNLYTGASLSFENHQFTDKEIGGIFNTGNYLSTPKGSIGFIGLSQSYDSRNSNNYPTKGSFGRITIQYAPNIDSKINFSGVQTKINLRNFTSLSKKFVLGLQGYYHGVSGTNIPFFILPQLGNDELMRGYYSGRYRDKNLIAGQAELRYRYNSRFGAVIFGGTGSVFGIEDFKLSDLKPNYGAGFRYFFDPEKGLSIRLDYGVGEKLPFEKRQSGFYISLSEAF